MKINLFTTLGCHLCEDALIVLKAYSDSKMPLDIIEIEISDSDRLIDAYGIRIPVVEILGASEDLGWPFDLHQLEAYIRSHQ